MIFRAPLRGLWAALLAVGLTGAAIAEDTVRAVYVLDGAPEGDAGKQTIAVLNDRLDRMGLSPKIQQQGPVILAEIDEPTDKNEMALIMTGRGVFSAHAADAIVQTCPETVPEGKVCAPTISDRAPFMVIDRTPGIAGPIIDRAVGLAEDGKVPQVVISLNRWATGAFGDFTSKNIGKRVAIVIDGMIITAPKVQIPITNGTAVLAGPGIPAVAWAVMLSSPPLPRKLNILGIDVKASAD